MKFAFLKVGSTFKKPGGRKVYTKTGVRSATDEKGVPETFNTRDIVEPTMVKVKAVKIEREPDPEPEIFEFSEDLNEDDTVTEFE